MNVLILGGTGQLARALRHAAPAARVLARPDLDLARPDAAAACLETALAREPAPDAVINAAAYTAVDAAESDAETAMAVNGMAPGHLAAVAAARGIPFLHVSTDYVFDGSGDRPWRPGDSTAPLGVYGQSKLAGEAAVAAAGGAYAILRTSWVFSADGANFVKTMLRLSETRDRLRIVADQVGGPTEAGDIAQALLTMAGALAAGQGGGVYHYAGAPDVSWAGFAREIFARAGRAVAVDEIPTADYPTPARRPLNSRLDCAGTETDFGLARPDWRAALDRVLDRLGARG